MFDWNDWHHFLAVARKGSTLAAAKSLGLSQSTVHRRLVALEASIGRRLVRRHPTGYRLTKLGEELRPLAERMEASAAELERFLVSADPGRTGTVRVACPASAAHRLMTAGLLSKFHARHPKLRAEFVMTEEFLDLAQGEVELAIRQGLPDDRSLIVRRIADVPWAVYASRAYIERHGRPRRLDSIADHFLVEFDGPMKSHAAAIWMRSLASGATIAARGNSVSEILMAVKSGVGLAPLPMPFAASEPDLSAVVETRPALNFPFYLVIHRDMRRVRRVRAFLEFVSTEIKTVRPVLSGPTP
jgi:DNA-binding transcriptional LysR family regulator